MDTKTKKSKKQIKPHFRTNKINGHPSYIYAEKGDDYKYIGITHSKKTHGLKNIPLKYNPNSKDSRQSYMRPFSTHDKKGNFKKKRLKGYRIHKADKKKVRRIKRNYKK